MTPRDMDSSSRDDAFMKVPAVARGCADASASISVVDEHTPLLRHSDENLSASGGLRADDNSQQQQTASSSAYVRICLVYFCATFAFASYSPFFTLFMKDASMTARAIGSLGAMQVVGGQLFAPPIGIFCDKYQVHKPVWATMWLLVTIPVLSIPLFQPHAFGHFVAIAVSVAALSSPCGALLDASALALLGHGNEKHFGKIRLWGAVGWGVGCSAGGVVVTYLGRAAAFYGFAIFIYIALVVMLTLPLKQAFAAKDELNMPLVTEGNEEEQPRQAMSMTTKLATLLRQPSFAVFLGVMVVVGMGATTLQSLLLIFLKDLGAPDWLEGTALTVATVAELPVFHYSSNLIGWEKMGAPGLLVVSIIAFIVRANLVALLQNPYWVLPLQLFHGFTYAGSYAAGVYLAKQSAPPGLEVTAQALFSFCYIGVGGLLGSSIGGVLFDEFGAPNMFRVKSALNFFALVVLCALHVPTRRTVRKWLCV